jgi:hypothetical protein
MEANTSSSSSGQQGFTSSTSGRKRRRAGVIDLTLQNGNSENRLSVMEAGAEAQSRRTAAGTKKHYGAIVSKWKSKT